MISEVTRPRVSGKEPRVQEGRRGPNNKKKMRSATQVLECVAVLEKKTNVKKSLAVRLTVEGTQPQSWVSHRRTLFCPGEWGVSSAGHPKEQDTLWVPSLFSFPVIPDSATP